MKQSRLALWAFLLCFCPLFSFGQVTGIQTVPGSFASLEAAVTALNATGVGAGGATINVAAGYTETPTTSLILTMATNAPTAANPLVIQKSGSGANPLITAFTPGVSTTVDGIFILNGVDYVTINGIDLQENAANTTATTQMEWGYALTKTSGTNGAQYNTIKNCTVTLNKANTASVGIYLGNHLSNVTTAMTVTAAGGTSSFNKFHNNTVTNCYGGYSLNGFASVAPYDFYDQSNQIGTDGVSTRRSQVTNFGGTTTTANGIFTIYQNGLSIFKTYINNNGGAPQLGVMNGIFTSVSLNASVNIYNDTLTLSSASTTGSTLIGINNAIGATGAGNTVSIYNNVVDGCTYATNTTGVFRAINSTATATYTNIFNNKVTNNSMPGTGELSGIYYSGSSATLCLVVNLNNNEVSGNTKTGTAGTMYMIYASASVNTINCYSNLLFNNNNSTSSSTTYGYYNFAFGYTENVYNNQMYNNTGGGGETYMIHARSGSGPTNKDVYGNTIYGILGNTTATVGAIYTDYGTTTNIYRNNIYNISNTSTTGGVPATAGIIVGSNVNTLSNVYNNFISELKAPNATSALACIMGIWLNGSATSVMNAYYNTVYLNAVGTGTNFGSSALYCGPNLISADISNNILVNVSNATGTGLNRAITRSNTTFTNYALTSGHNCLFAGTPSATNLIYYDFTNSDQTIQAFKNRVGPREQASFSSLPPFVNVSTSPYNLHLQNAVASQCESGGKAIVGITTDYDNTSRGSTPDVGADEILGLMVDIASPDIQYTLLTNSSVAPNRVLSSFATVTDPSGVNTTLGTRPRLYYKRTTNANTYNTNTNATDGWKYVEASNAASPFSFTIDYSLLFGGGVVAGDIIQYFVVAQDLNGTPIVGINNGGFTTQPTSVNLGAANFPLNNTINQYTILAGALSGVVNVGPAEAITSLTNTGGIFQLINAGVLSGNLTINITGDLTVETGTVALNQWAEQGTGNYTVTIAPSAAVVRNIYGTNATASLVRFDGADRVNIDGRFAGNGTYLMFRNTSNTAPTIGYINDAQNNTLQYTIVESGNTAVSTTLGGAVFIGTTTGLNGNDNITINNCEIRDRSDVAGTPAYAINIVGTNGTIAQYNSNITISNNNIHDWFILNSTSYAINTGAGATAMTIQGNSFYQTATRTNTLSGGVIRAINIAFTSTVNNNGGNTISGNFIGGSAPGATGTDMVLTVSGVGTSQTFGGISVVTGLIPNQIQGNTIRRIDFTTNTPTAAATNWFGINLGQGIHNVGTTTGNTIGDIATNSSIKITLNAGGAVSNFLAGILASTGAGSYTIQNNTIAGITIAGTTTGAVIPQWIQIQGTPSQTTIVSNNTIGGPLGNSIQNNVTTSAAIGFAIRQVVSSGAAITANANTIQNITDNSTNAGSSNFGILITSTVGGSGTATLTNNIVKDMTFSAGGTPAFAHYGIAMQGYAGQTHIISGNLISNLFNSSTAAVSSYVVGMQIQGNTTGGTIFQNRIWDLRNANTGSPGIAGIYFSAGLNWTVNNNMISLANTGFTSNMVLTGITDFAGQGSVMTYNYNSIFVGGSQPSGSTDTYGYMRGGLANTTLRNNLFYNRRTGGAGNHYAVGNVPTVPSTGWNSNYNAMLTADTTKLNQWGVAVNNMAAWRGNSGGDLNSIYEITSTITAATLFVNPALGDLHINTSTYPEALATPLPLVTVDYDNNARSATFPTIGADELPCSAIAFTVSAQTNVSCNGGNNGSATVSGAGGNGLTYSWAPSGGTAATATGLAAGTYTCTIANICGNVGTVSVTITQPSVVTASSSVTNVTCNAAANGTATVVASGGTPGYTYAWLPSGGNAATATGLAPGTYTCTITDANSCTATQSVTITEPSVLSATSAQSNILCFGDSSGTASVTATGGTPGYTYSWAPYGGSAATATGLASGTFTCTITDANNCTTTQTFALGDPLQLVSSALAQTDPLCNGGNDGTASIDVLGGTPGYTYLWSPSGGTNAIETGLTAGTYTCVVTDANGCTTSQSFTITDPALLVATAVSQTNVSCNGGANGDATVSVTGGTPNYSYAWAPSGGSNATASGLTAGSYTCTITDGNNCTTTQTFNIIEPLALSVVFTSQTNVSCNGGSDGIASVVISGGTPGYAFSWAPTGGTSGTASGLAIGSYTCTITDTLGCSVTQTFSITEPAALVSSITSTTNVTTCNGSDGAIDISVSGGSPNYTFAWSNGPVTEDVTGLTAGTYTVTITDANGCIVIDSASVTDPDAPAVSVTFPFDTICQSDPVFTLSGESPVGGTYSGSGVGANNTFNPAQALLGNNVVTYTYTDANGCTGTTTAIVMVDACTGIPTLNNNQGINLYPNPNDGQFTFTSTENGTLQIFNSLGQVVYSERTTAGTHDLILNTVDAGVYYMQFTTTNNEVKQMRFVIQR
jgi:hypothetical protein